ncbi:flagellar basal body protein [Paucibacter sediminis]|uniref:Flagellar protein FliL n=1 Tax=Paucibacter sediminis TaxID=3019553 RepID=A0AA95NKM3_9BURK|nr:flagellar basal body protein [Paucibacter sp. S2-9]WIT11396.1 flagellar basal body protein [Paucibacter sp. S2-9]
MSKIKLMLALALAVLLAAGSAGGAVWWSMRAPQASASEPVEPPAKPGPDYKYVTLDKVLVMLRGRGGEAMAHYMAVDVVFKTLPEQEKRTKEHLALLRTIAVKALAGYNIDSASALTIEQIADELNRAYREGYGAEHREPPFAEALIGKLIIE